jgi:hypothetical protein
MLTRSTDRHQMIIHHVQIACPPGSEEALEDFRPSRKAHPV